jgi:hypothetical protein
MLIHEDWAAITRSCITGIWKNKKYHYLAHDFKGFSVDEDLN